MEASPERDTRSRQIEFASVVAPIAISCAIAPPKGANRRAVALTAAQRSRP